MRPAAPTAAAAVAVHGRRFGRALAPVIAVAVVLVVLTAITAFVVVALPYQHAGSAPGYLLLLGASWVLFATAIVLLRWVSPRAVPALVLIGSAAIGGAAIAGPPDTTTDTARYAWDGIVQDAGISPYAYVPADAHLARLRPEWLFPKQVAGPSGPVCHGVLAHATPQVGARRTICTVMNRPLVPTIYPPAAEIVYAAVRAVVPASAQYWPMQALGLLVMLATTAVLLTALRRRERDPRFAALWGWCPLVAAEGVTNSHIDLLGAALALGASLLVTRGAPGRRSGRRVAERGNPGRWATGRGRFGDGGSGRGSELLGGVLLGLGVAVKLTPLLVAPPLLKRSPLRVGVAALVTVALLYLPYVLASGPQVLGYLPGYLNEEGYASGMRSALLATVLPAPFVTAAVVLLLGAVVVIVTVRSRPDDPFVAQLIVVGAALLLASPRYGWYGLLLVPFIALTGRWEWFAVALVLTFSQLGGAPGAIPPALAAAGIICLLGQMIRRRASRA